MLKHRGLLVALQADVFSHFVSKAVDILLWKSIFLLLSSLNAHQSHCNLIVAFLLIVPYVFIL